MKIASTRLVIGKLAGSRGGSIPRMGQYNYDWRLKMQRWGGFATVMIIPGLDELFE
ncbi:MAG TPA: hypothetical protein VNF99_07040 [Stellaceae bacterium]|nr:hypothetical protein [Stellaceae bacterium]